jgi:hypothetical protein
MDEMAEELLVHIVEILDALFIIAELDGKPCHNVNVLQRKQVKNYTEYYEQQ